MSLYVSGDVGLTTNLPEIVVFLLNHCQSAPSQLKGVAAMLDGSGYFPLFISHGYSSMQIARSKHTYLRAAHQLT